MDPGRRKHEPREAEFVAVGEEILLGSGVLWTVAEIIPGPALVLRLERRQGERVLEGTWTGHPSATITVRNRLTSQS